MDYKILVVGSGFGGSMTALTLAERTADKDSKILILERGTWWTTPVSTVQDKEVFMFDFLRKHDQPVQYWSSQNHFRGLVDALTRCFRRTRDSGLLPRLFPSFRNEDGLYDLTWFGRRGLFSHKGDGVIVARACGVGGGSLVYSNITIRPPDFVSDGPRWPEGVWTEDPADGDPAHKNERRDYYYDYARDAIGFGVVYALRTRESDRSSHVVAHPNRIAAEIEDWSPGVSLTVKQAAAGGTASVTYAAPPELTPEPMQAELRKGRQVWLNLDAAAPAPTLKGIIPQGPLKVNTGLSNILARTARLNPFEAGVLPIDQKPFNKRGLWQLPKEDPDQSKPPAAVSLQDPKHALWLDRARVFQGAVRSMADEYGAVDLSINDLPWEGQPLGTGGKPKNYCERQGRCNVGCLPGARHTLNKQLVRAVVGRFDPPAKPGDAPKEFGPDFPNLELRALCEVDVIRALPGGGYEVTFEQQTIDNYRAVEAGKDKRRVERVAKTAEIVILAAGTVGSSEILLCSKAKGGLPGLSERTGFGFSPNGDYIAFLEPTRERVSLIRGPVTTSFGHFETGANGAGDSARFHTVEDQGIPPATASVLGEALPLIRRLASGHTGAFLVVVAIWRYLVKLTRRTLRELFGNSRRRGRLFESEEELAAKMMAIAAMGRDEADASFRLGTGAGDTRLRVAKAAGADGRRREFWDDPIYNSIRATLKTLAGKLSDEPGADFIHPTLGGAAEGLGVKAIPTSHPLGGCIMAKDASGGTVNAHGQPFDTSGGDPQAVYRGLYVADGSIVPSALGVNPSLTIAALALRISDRIYAAHF